MTVFEQHTHELLQSACRKIPDVTLRDLFAMSVMPALLKDFSLSNESIKYMAIKSYIIADEMLEAREKK